jgi:hypothetical protein
MLQEAERKQRRSGASCDKHQDNKNHNTTWKPLLFVLSTVDSRWSPRRLSEAKTSPSYWKQETVLVLDPFCSK